MTYMNDAVSEREVAEAICYEAAIAGGDGISDTNLRRRLCSTWFNECAGELSVSYGACRPETLTYYGGCDVTPGEFQACATAAVRKYYDQVAFLSCSRTNRTISVSVNPPKECQKVREDCLPLLCLIPPLGTGSGLEDPCDRPPIEVDL